MTREIWNEYKDLRGEEGVPFKDLIFSGIKNQDSGIGVYAASHDSYIRFNKLFDKIIQTYHGHRPSDTHPSDMSWEGL